MMSSKTIYFLFGLFPYHIFERVGNHYTVENIFRNLLNSTGLIDKYSSEIWARNLSSVKIHDMEE